MFLLAEDIDDVDGGFRTVRRSKVIRDNDGCVGRGRGVHDASKGMETTTEAAGDRRRDRGIYGNDGGVLGVR